MVALNTECMTREAEKFVLYNYLNSFARNDDVISNYSVIKYELLPKGEKTNSTITQRLKGRKALNYSLSNRRDIIDSLKNMLEK